MLINNNYQISLTYIIKIKKIQEFIILKISKTNNLI